MGTRGLLADWQAAGDAIRRAAPRLIVFHVWYGLIVGTVLSAAVAWVLNRMVLRAGSQAVTNYDLVSFFLSGPGIAFAVILAGAFGASYFLERAGLLWMLADPAAGVRPIEALRASLRLGWPLVRLAWWYTVILAALALPFVGIGLIVAKSLLGSQDINYYLYHQPREWRLALVCGGVLAVGAAVTAFVVLIRLTFAVPVVLLEQATPRQALGRSWNLTRGRFPILALTLGGWWLMATGATALISAGTAAAAVACLNAFPDSRTSLAIILGFGAMLAILNAAGHLLTLSGEAFLTNRLFMESGGSTPGLERRVASAGLARRYAWLTTAVLVAGYLGTLAFTAQKLVKADLNDEFTVTAHRAGAAAAPENTLAALKQAIAEGADLAEIDVQSTRDGHLVILHDADLARIGGDRRRVQDLSFAAIREIDIGTWHAPAFAGERVATLAEFVDTARGKIRLNVELKYNRPDPELAGRVIELLKREGVLSDYVITSLEASALQQVRKLAPEARVGLIVTKAIGDPTRVDADFLSLNQGAVSSRLIHRAHARGLKVHVWTVNKRADMERMVELGADSLITDYPREAVALRRDRAALSNLEKLVLQLRAVLLRR